MISSQSAPGAPDSVAERYARAVERFRAVATAISSTNPTPSSNGPTGAGGGASSLFDVIEKAIGYGIEPPQPDETGNRPPLDSYETTPGPYGDIYRATNAYVSWFRRAYCVEGGEDRVSQPRIGPPNKEMGGGDSGSLVSRGRWQQNDLAP